MSIKHQFNLTTSLVKKILNIFWNIKALKLKTFQVLRKILFLIFFHEYLFLGIGSTRYPLTLSCCLKYSSKPSFYYFLNLLNSKNLIRVRRKNLLTFLKLISQCYFVLFSKWYFLYTCKNTLHYVNGKIVLPFVKSKD